VTDAGKRVHAFLFGTRLTNVTRALKAKDPDEALAACSASVADWSGGTRIASSLAAFNKQWALYQISWLPLPWRTRVPPAARSNSLSARSNCGAI
jgi:uncharacterized protein with von Willebrand factor type A (vWA) domain